MERGREERGREERGREEERYLTLRAGRDSLGLVGEGLGFIARIR